MRQLGQLQRNYEKFEEADTEIIAVFREEKEGAEGLKKARESSKATYPFLMDLGSEQTGPYSAKGFSTYVIGKDGKIKAELGGTKMVRPSAEKVLATVEESMEAATATP